MNKLTVDRVREACGGKKDAYDFKITEEKDGIRVKYECGSGEGIGMIVRAALALRLDPSQIRDASGLETSGGGTYTGSWTDLVIDTTFLHSPE